MIDPGVRRVVFLGRHKPIPGGLAAAVRAADTHENNTADSLPLGASSYVTFRIKAGSARLYCWIVTIFVVCRCGGSAEEIYLGSV